jgi:aspartyl-tRNA synthetase
MSTKQKGDRIMNKIVTVIVAIITFAMVMVMFCSNSEGMTTEEQTKAFTEWQAKNERKLAYIKVNKPKEVVKKKVVKKRRDLRMEFILQHTGLTHEELIQKEADAKKIALQKRGLKIYISHRRVNNSHEKTVKYLNSKGIDFKEEYLKEYNEYVIRKKARIMKLKEQKP